MPGPLVTPEVGLQARHRLEAYCDQQIATRRRCRLREIVGVDKSRLSQICGDVCQSGNGAPVAREGPDINSRYAFVRTRKKLMTWVLQIDAVAQKGTLSSAIEIKERYSAQQLPRPFKRKDRLRIAAQKLKEPSFRDADPRNFAPGNGHQIGQLCRRRQTHSDRGGWRKPIQLVSDA